MIKACPVIPPYANSFIYKKRESPSMATGLVQSAQYRNCMFKIDMVLKVLNARLVRFGVYCSARLLALKACFILDNKNTVSAVLG